MLRYHAGKDTKLTLDVEVDNDLTAGTVNSSSPTLAITLAVGVDEVRPDASVKLRAEVIDVTAKPRDESRVQPAPVTEKLQALKGLVLRSTLSPGGRSTAFALDGGGKALPVGLDEQLAQLSTGFQQVMMPLPEEPVGIGATWRSSRPVDQSGMKMIAVNTITVTAIDGDKLSFTIETQIHGDDQSVVQAGTRIDIKDITGTGKGNGMVDLGTLATTSQLLAELRTQMTAAGESEPTSMRMAMLTKVSSR